MNGNSASHASPDYSRRTVIALCALAAFACLMYAATREHLPGWWKSSAGGIPYVLFFIFLWAILFPTRKCILPICVGVTLITSALEVLQLWNPPALSAIRKTRLGVSLLGGQFEASDFVAYLVGCVIGLIVLWRLPADPARH